MRMLRTAALVGSGLIAAASAAGFCGQDAGQGSVDVHRKVPFPFPPARKLPANPPAEAAKEPGAGKPEPVGEPSLSIAPYHLSLKGESARDRDKLLAKLNRAGVVPQNRKDHFRWVQECGGAITGWDVVATEVTPGDDGVLITLSLYPVHTSGATRVNDLFLETYLLTERGPIFISSREASPGPKVIVF